MIVLDNPVSTPLDAVGNVFESNVQSESGIVVFFDELEENQVSAVRYSLVDDLFTARGGVVTTFDNLSFEDLAEFTADNFEVT